MYTIALHITDANGFDSTLSVTAPTHTHVEQMLVRMRRLFIDDSMFVGETVLAFIVTTPYEEVDGWTEFYNARQLVSVK